MAHQWPKEMPVNAMGHIAINCIDKRAMEKFYVEVFGFSRARVFKAGTPEEFVVLRLGEMCIELFPTPASSPGAKGGEQPVGFKHLAFTVGDIDAKVGELQAAGIETGEIEDCNHLAEGLRVCFFKDPEGNILEIMEGWSDQQNPPALS